MVKERSHLRQPPFYVLVILAGYLTYLVLGPFIVPLTWAAVFAVLFHDIYAGLARRTGPNRASLIVTLLVGSLIVAPGVFLLSVVASEAPGVATYIQQASFTEPKQVERIWTGIRARSPVALPDEPTELVREGVQRTLSFLAPRAGAVLADVLATLGSLVAMLFALYFVLRDGDALSRELRDLLPVPPHEAEQLLGETRDLIIASVGAGLVVAAAQGAIGGVAFWALGVPSPIVWAVVIAFASLIPVVGAVVVWLPTALWFLFSGDITRAVVLIAVGVIGIGLVDNVLRPLLLSGRSSVNGLVVFFGLLGGVAAFGFIGLVLGPIVLVVTGRLLRMFARPDLVHEPLIETNTIISG